MIVRGSLPVYDDDMVRIYCGDALELCERLPESAISCVVTSPPYWRQRDYGVHSQIGKEASPEEYVNAVASVFRVLRRALSPFATVWLNLGDTFGARPRQLLLLPSRVALAMQEMGYVLRADIIWHKPNASPESAADRPSRKYEHLFLFGASERYFFDLDAIKVEPKLSSRQRAERFRRTPSSGDKYPARDRAISRYARKDAERVNPGDVWSIPNSGFRGSHYAVFPDELPRRALLAGCPREVCAGCARPASAPVCASCGSTERRHAVVLDPFCGSGTTLCVAKRLGLAAIGFDINPDYCKIAADRVRHEGRPLLSINGG